MAVEVDAVFNTIQMLMVFATWSYLYRENIFSRCASVIVIAFSTVHWFLYYTQRFWDRGVVKVMEGQYQMIIPIILGLMIFTRLTRKYSWLASISYSIRLGMGTGTALSTLFSGTIATYIVLLVEAPFKSDTMLGMANGVLLFVGALFAMTYWLFTVEAIGWLSYVTKIGRWFLMASIGMLYAEDVLWAQSIFVGAWEIVIDGFIKAVLLGITG